MALIPITFKADNPDGKKGNVRAEDLSALFGFLYPNKAGILNITGQDCSAFGSINVVGNTAQVTFHKGYIVIYGRAIYIEEGTQVAFNLPTIEVSGVLGVKINLAENGANEVTWFQKTTTPQTDDLLNSEASGVYEFVLYNYTATSNNLILGEKTSEIIDNIDKKFVDDIDLLGVISAITRYSTTAQASDESHSVNHTWIELNIRNYKIIMGKLQGVHAETRYLVNWGTNKFLDNTYFVNASFTTEDRSSQPEMKYPVYSQIQTTSGFNLYNANTYSVTMTYIAIGKYKE